MNLAFYLCPWKMISAESREMVPPASGVGVGWGWGGDR